MILLKVERDRLRLPRGLSRWLKGQREVAAFLEGDALVLKRLSVSPASTYAPRGQGRAPALSAINAEVHRARRSRR